MTDEAKVEQIDREAAQALWAFMQAQGPVVDADGGRAIGRAMLNAFARHRLAARPAPAEDAVERVAKVLTEQMEEQDEHLPSSLARERGLVWLDGWFDLQAALAAMQPRGEQQEWPADAAFAFGALVQKKGRASWRGKIVGWYRTDVTALGYAVESTFEPGSVQIYPETALLAWDGEQQAGREEGR